MLLFHLSDLHLGKRVYQFPMTEDQQHILRQILDAARDRQPDGVIIAGDIYDKSNPPVEAVTLFDDFLYELSGLTSAVFIISGNHDSPERLAFGSRIVSKSGIHISRVCDGSLSPITLTDSFGEVEFYLLPFIKPAAVRHLFPGEDIKSCSDAVRAVLSAVSPDSSGRRVLAAHQFVTGAERSESEEIFVGGAENVDASVFERFDYVALGHLHRPQDIRSEKSRIRYCGTPLKYSFSEMGSQNSITAVTLAEKGSVAVETIPLDPLREMRSLRGKFDELTPPPNPGAARDENYYKITLTDENPIPNAAAELRRSFPNLMTLDYDNGHTRPAARLPEWDSAERKTPEQLFAEFYQSQRGRPMSPEQLACIRELIEETEKEMDK